MALPAPAKAEPWETWIPLCFPCLPTQEGEAHRPKNGANVCFPSWPRPPRGGRQCPHTAEFRQALWPPFSSPTGDLFARIFSPPFIFHNTADPSCYYFSRLIEYVLLTAEACRQRQAQQAQREGGLGGPSHLGSPGPAPAGPGGRLWGNRNVSEPCRPGWQQPTGVRVRPGRRES